MASPETEEPRDRQDRDAADEARGLHASILAVHTRLAVEADELRARWMPMVARAEFRDSVANLAAYLAFRKADLTALQPGLAALGLSTLGRCEAHVEASVEAVLAALATIGGLEPAAFPSPERFRAGRDLLHARQIEIFGEDPRGPATRIMVTLPTEAATDPSLLPDLIDAGADCLRINCAHDSPEVWRQMIERGRAAADDLGRDVRILMDLGGPKVRIAHLGTPHQVRLFRGDRLVIAPTAKPRADGLPVASLTHPELLGHLEPGSEVWIDDGKIGARVISVEDGAALIEVINAKIKGVKLRVEKGVNLPGVDIAIPALTAADLAALDFVVGRADIVGFSFVQTPDDVRDLLAAIRARAGTGPLPAMMLKIETELAVRNLPRLIVAAGGAAPVAVMIARGDLAVELGLERLSEIQEELLWLCEAAHVPVVWATQVLEGLMKDNHATRAETTDAAMGQRAECVMLNKGPFAVEAVRFLDRVLRRMDRHQSKKSPRLGPLRSWSGDPDV